MKFCKLLFLLFISSNGVAQSTKDSIAIAQLIIADYKTLGNWDLERHLQNCTKDYILIENGEIQTLADESEYFKKNAARVISRTDTFNFRRITIINSIAYAVYNLQSTIVEKGVAKKYHWSESVVCTKINKEWKIALLHSTSLVSKN